jgi:hypothetical protein
MFFHRAEPGADNQQKNERSMNCEDSRYS